MIHDTQSAQISQNQDERNIYAIMKTMCLPGYHQMTQMSCHKVIVVITGWAHCFHDCTHTHTNKHTHTHTHKMTLTSGCYGPTDHRPSDITRFLKPTAGFILYS